MAMDILRLEQEIASLKQEKSERERALPAHSIRPHQLLAIEELEEEILNKERELAALKKQQEGEIGSPPKNTLR